MEVLEFVIPARWFDKGIALQVVRHYFSHGKDLIRIATGFFTVRGYNLIRASARGKRMYILVGLDDPGRERARKALVDEIMRDLRTGVDLDRRQAVVELVEKMEGGNFRIIDARAKEHHAKLFIIDADIALIASSNVSQRGMLDAIEAGTVESDPFAVAEFVQEYDRHFYAPDSLDITKELIEQLRRWLGMTTPWEIYLKTLWAIKSLDEIDVVRTTYRRPVGYQSDVIAHVLRQMDDFNGAITVASTGLGKTVIAADVALRLKRAGVIENVLVIGPDPVRKEWNDHLRPAGISVEYFNHLALNTADLDRNRYAEELQDRFEKELDEKYLVIIDESHNLRNRYRRTMVDGRYRKIELTAFKRFRMAVEDSNCKVLLLTATPYAKELENINNQLYLLPHRGPNKALMEDFVDGARAWQINDIFHLKDLPVSSVITTPYVAKHYGTSSPEGIYVDFNGQKMYFPKVILYGIRAPMLLEDDISRILDNRLLARKPARSRQQPIENQARIAWGSSPLAIREVLEKTCETVQEGGYKVEFELDIKERRDELRPLIRKLKELDFSQDEKLLGLLEVIDCHYSEGGKTIVYSERHATIAYLEKALKQLRPSLKVASTVEFTSGGISKLKNNKKIRKILENFAPISNRKLNYGISYDLLLATDAHGVGINLQDATTVINYDLAWTAVEPDQRAGRILRFWAEPREVNLYVFIPYFSKDSLHKHKSTLAIRRWEKLTTRHAQAKIILDMPTLTRHSQHEVDLQSLGGDQRIIRVGEIDLHVLEDRDSSKIFEHTATLVRYKDQANKISDDIISALAYDGKVKLIYVLLKVDDKYRWTVYDLNHRQLTQHKTDVDLLQLILCDERTPTAAIDPNEIEKAADVCIRAWCKKHEKSYEDVTRICSLYLVPEKLDLFELMLE
jgi:hypothetical protein